MVHPRPSDQTHLPRAYTLMLGLGVFVVGFDVVLVGRGLAGAADLRVADGRTVRDG
ncbi:MAG: hypothetical protein HOV78_13715, partial [Hamadaea sp.]|nr:hypothetical protein [Hamadaea sp.]